MREDVIHSHTSTASTTKSSIRINTCMTITIIPSLFLRITQDFISFSSFFKFLLCFLISRILIRVKFNRFFSICFLDCRLICRFVNPQYFVIISFCHALLLCLFAYYYLSVTNNLIIKGITKLDCIDNLTFHLWSWSRYFSNCFM